MKTLRFTLVADGSSDAALLPIINWTLRSAGVLPEGSFADPRRLPKKLPSLSAKLKAALERFPCQVLFVHRDAEAGSWESRRDEIKAAMVENGTAVALIPVRISEAWLCFDEGAIRQASGNPKGTIPLVLPRLARIESDPDPKSRLHDALRTASELTGRRRKSFDPHEAVHLLAEDVGDYSPLRALPAFRRFEAAIAAGVHAGWRPGLYADLV